MASVINETKIEQALTKASTEDTVKVREVLAKALQFRGLNLDETACLMGVKDPELLQELFTAANQVKEEIYGKRIVLFAPLYVSNLCTNECSYCAFRVGNQELIRRYLSSDEIKKEVEELVNQGHKRILMLAGEAYPHNDFQYIIDAINTIYQVKNPNGEIRRVNVNLAPQDVEGFKRLKEAKIGTYQLFQETYHRETYQKVHQSGKKADYDWRISVFDRALEAGIDDVGFGVLFGLYDWKYELLALLEHANYLQEHFGVGPHTISVPRIEPALGSEISKNPIAPVSDLDFCKIIAILRLAVPYTGIILSTRETPAMRQKTFALGVSQISAGSRTDPGGYTDANLANANQFVSADLRSLDEVVRDLASLGYFPSFCTACYRLGRTGEDFMCLSKHGKIKNLCSPNAISTFAEYLHDCASAKTKAIGEKLIQAALKYLPSENRQVTEKLLARINMGEKDVFI